MMMLLIALIVIGLAVTLVALLISSLAGATYSRIRPVH